MADFFISFTRSDLQWAQWLAEDLRALGHAAHVHSWEIKAGEDIVAWMEQRHSGADHVLCVVSADYLNAAYSQLEHNAALWRAVRERSSFLLYAVVKPCALPALTRHMRRCDLFNLPEPVARQRFRDYIATPQPIQAAFPGDAVAESNITIRLPPHFIGRDQELAAIHAHLTSGSRLAVTALHGLRGVGKTLLAAAYAHAHQRDYRATWWVRAETADTARADLAALAVQRGWARAEDPQDLAVARAMDGLRDDGDGILLILDNAPDKHAAEPFLPPAGAARTLITSNSPVWRGVADLLEIHTWPPETGADFLLSRAGRPKSEREAALALSGDLGGLPLAHEMAGAYCEEKHITLADYRTRFAAAPAALLDHEQARPGRDYHDRLTVTKAFHLAIDAAATRHPAAERLLLAAALLPPEPVPLYLFTENPDEFAEDLGAALAGEGLEDARAALRALALIADEDLRTPAELAADASEVPALRLHRLVRAVAATRRQPAAADAVRAGLIAALAQTYPPGFHEDPRHWPRARQLDALAVGLLDERPEPPAGAAAAAALLLDVVAKYRQYVLGAAAEARRFYERALALDERHRGPEHPDTLTSVNNLASCLRALGDAAAARPLHERALAARERVLGPEHPDTLTSVNNLAGCLESLGDAAAARPLHERALAALERVLGPEHPHTLTGVNNLAGCLYALGDAAAARPLHERALAARERVLGPEHPDTLISVNNLAGCLDSLGDAAAARPLHERALAAFERVLGPEHPDTLTSVNNLAACLDALGDAAAARPLHERALAARERVLGPEHPDTLTSVNNLAFCLYALGDAAAALPLARRALAGAERVLGAVHPTTRIFRANLAAVEAAVPPP